MKAILAFLLIAAVTATEFKGISYDLTDGPTAVDFMRGFLKGIGETKNIDELLKCVTGLEEIIKKINDGINDIMKLTFEDIIKGFNKIMGAMVELGSVLEKCAMGYDTLEKLITAIINADFGKVLQKLMSNMFTYIAYFTNAYNCFIAETYECAGLNIGSILKGLFLSEVLDATMERVMALDFLKGFVEGLGGSFRKEDFEACIKDMQTIIDAIKAAFDAIKTGNFQKIFEGVKMIIQATKQLVYDLEKCTKNVKVIVKLIEALKNIDIQKISMKIIGHIIPIIQLITSTLPCFATQDFYCIGKGLGSFLKIALF